MTEDYISVLETARKVFVFANAHNWDGLRNEVFATNVTIDDSSYPGAPQAITLPVARLVDNWKGVFSRIPITMHLLTNELVTVNGNHATMHVYVTGIHVKPTNDDAPARWTVYSTYDIDLHKVAGGSWRVIKLKQNYLFQEGHPNAVVKIG